MSPTVSRVDTAAGFVSLEREWNGLLERSRSRSVFMTWDWLEAWWRGFGSRDRLRIYTVRGEGDRLVGLAPLCVTPAGRWLAPRTLTFLGTVPVSSEYLDLVAERGWEEAVLRSLLEAVRGEDGGWDCMVLSDVLDSSLVLEARQRLADSDGLIVEAARAQVCPYLPLPSDVDAFMRGLGRRFRESLRRKRRRLEALGLEIRDVRDPGEVPEALESLFALHSRRWSLRGLPGNLGDARVQAFHREVASRFARKGWLRLHTLRSRGRPIAVLYGFAYAERYWYYQAGFDPDWGHASPGAALMLHAIERAIGEGLREFDYLRGPEEYKSHWTSASRTTWRLTVVPRRNRKAVLWYRTHAAVRAMKRAAKRVVPETWVE